MYLVVSLIRLNVLSASDAVALMAKARSISGTGGSSYNSKIESQIGLGLHTSLVAHQAGA